MFLVRLPFTCLVQSSTTVNLQYKVLCLIKLLEQCRLLQSATGVFCKVLQVLKVRQFSAIDTAKCYGYYKVLQNKELRLKLRQRHKTYLLLLGV